MTIDIHNLLEKKSSDKNYVKTKIWVQVSRTI